jgi:hypothetical protein
MTEIEKKLILEFSLQRINIDEFLQNYSKDVDSNHVLQLLNEAYDKKDFSEVEYALLLGFIFKTFSDEYVEMLCRLIQEDWHYKHEDIALVLQELRSPKSVDALYAAAFKKLDYLSYDDSFALARKCIHALGDIRTENAKEKLKLLAQSDISIIREKAEKQLLFFK